MSHDERRNTPSRKSIVAVDIAAANAARGHAHKHLEFARLRPRHIGNGKLSVLFQQQRFHRRPRSTFSSKPVLKALCIFSDSIRRGLRTGRAVSPQQLTLDK